MICDFGFAYAGCWFPDAEAQIRFDQHFELRGCVRKFCHRYYNFVNKHDRLLYNTLIERATFLLYDDVKIMPERNKYLEIDTLKDTWGKTNGTFSRICEYYCVRFMRHIVITTDQIFSTFTVINNSIILEKQCDKNYRYRCYVDFVIKRYI